MHEAIAFALSQPIAALVYDMDSMQVLEQDLRTARDWQPMAMDEQVRLWERVAAAVAEGQLEHYMTR